MQKFKISTEVCFGGDPLEALHELRAENAVIFTDGFMAKSGGAARVASYMKQCQNIHVFSETKPDPPVEMVAQALRFLLDVKVDAVVALGGGSAIDAAKATIMIARRQTGRAIPLIAIPTTSGTGSEVTSFAVITDREKGVKYPLVDNSLLPEQAILSAELVKSVPPAITADTGFDVITHALEAYISTGANDYSDALAEKSLELAFAYLPRAYRNGNDLEAREKMHTASCLAGMAFNAVSLGVNHGIAHTLGANFHIPHGRANAMVLAEVMAFNGGIEKNDNPATAAKLAKIARHIGLEVFSDLGGARALVRKIRSLQKEIGIPATLGACGVTEEAYRKVLSHMIDSALNDACTKTNPRPVSAKDVEEILASLAKF